jgi:hypothetical protein
MLEKFRPIPDPIIQDLNSRKTQQKFDKSIMSIDESEGLAEASFGIAILKKSLQEPFRNNS